MTIAERLPPRAEVIERARASGRKVVAVLPFHYPRALLRAYRLHPIEVWGPPHVPRDEGHRHFQAYTCDIVVKATSFLLRGGMDAVDAILIPHTCDALQGMASVSRDFLRPRQPVLTLYLPRDRRGSDRAFLVEELRRLSARLGKISGHEPNGTDWAEAFASEGAADEALASLYRKRPRLAVSDREFYTAIRAREFLTAEEFCELVASLPEGERPSNGLALMLSGIVAEPLELFDRIHEMGACIVADDLACGYRRVYPPVEESDPFEQLAARLLAAPPDATRGSPIEQRVDALGSRMKESGARGLLIYNPKFCEPELFDVPLLRRHLNAIGYPVLHVEFEMGETLAHQVLTRIEAFVETLR
jgi:benzoyl-CoA reductase/2-hydroxyglutaryl-CoA dehydratase subunit BcrC/BadD/HgdB